MLHFFLKQLTFRQIIFLIISLLSINSYATSTMRSREAEIVLKDNLPCFYAQDFTTLQRIEVITLPADGTYSWRGTAKNENDFSGASQSNCLEYGNNTNLKPSILNLYEESLGVKSTTEAKPFKYNIPYKVTLTDNRHASYQDIYWYRKSFCISSNDGKYNLVTVSNLNTCTNELLVNSAEPVLTYPNKKLSIFERLLECFFSIR